MVVAISTSIVSCRNDFFEKPIDLDIDDHTSKLAGTAFLGIDDISNRVMVSYTQGPFENDNNTSQIVQNAHITLSSDDGDIVFNSTLQNNFYLANNPLTFIPNKAYTLTLEASNYTSISATQVYPESVAILDASINENTFKIKFNDNPDKKNYYVLRLFESDGNGGFYEHYIEPFGSLTKESGFCHSCLNFSDETFNGEQAFEIGVTNSYFDASISYKAVLYNVTEDFFRYDNSLLLSEYSQDNPFVEPVILHRNFENGYGIFGLINKSELLFNP